MTDKRSGCCHAYSHENHYKAYELAFSKRGKSTKRSSLGKHGNAAEIAALFENRDDAEP